MRLRPAVAAAAALALLAGPVVAAVDEDGAPAEAVASSGFTLLDLSLGGTDVRLLDVVLATAADGAPTLDLVPLRLDGQDHLAQSAEPGDGLAPVSTAGVAAGAPASVTTPFIGFARQGEGATAGATTLPALELLGLDVELDGTLAMASSATGSGSAAEKSVTITDLALPSLADLLGARGLRLDALPHEALLDLLDRLPIGPGDAVTTARATLTQAQAALDTALGDFADDVQRAEDAVLAARATVTATTGLLSAEQDALAAAELVQDAADAAVVRLASALLAAQAEEDAAELEVVEEQAAVGTASAQVDAAKAVVAQAEADVAQAEADVAEAEQDLLGSLLGTTLDALRQVLADAQAALQSAVEALDAAKQTLALVEQSLAAAQQALATSQVELTSATALVTDLGLQLSAAQTAATSALSTVGDLQASADALAQDLLDAEAVVASAVAQLQGLLLNVTTQVADLVMAAIGVLDAQPLLEVDELALTTRATATSATEGGQTAEVVSGRIRGLRLLGVPVLDEIALTDVTAPVQDAVDQATATIGDSLTSALAPLGVGVSAPVLTLLPQTTTTGVLDGVGTGTTTLSALGLDWAGISLPGVFTVSAAGDALSLRLASMTDTASFRPAVAPTPGSVVLEPAPLDPGPGGPDPSDPAPAPADPDPTDPTGPAPADPVREQPAPTDPAPAEPGLVDGGEEPPTQAPAPAVPPAVVRLPPAAGPPAAAPPVTAPARPRTTPVALTQLPRTGADSPTAVLALLLVAVALGLHRRRGTA